MPKDGAGYLWAYTAICQRLGTVVTRVEYTEVRRILDTGDITDGGAERVGEVMSIMLGSAL